MATFQKRGKSWQYTISRYIDGKYKPIRKGGFRTRAEAKAVADEIEYKLNKGLRIDNEPIAFAKYFEDWYTLFKTNVKKNTFGTFKDTLRYIKNHFDEKPIQKITRNDYQAFLNKLGKDYAKVTISKAHRHIKECLKHAVEDEIIRINFANRVTITGKPSKDKKDKYLNFEEGNRLYKTLFNRLDAGLSYYAVLLLLVSGIRFSELSGLTRNDFDFKENTIDINKTWGYSSKNPEGFGKTKNKQSERTIKIDPKVMKEFKKLFMQMPDNIHRLVFFSPRSKYKVLRNNTINFTLQKCLDDLGIKKKITAHELRHTHASTLIYQGADIVYVSERLGHANPDVTYKIYAHVTDELREKDDKVAVNIYK